MAVRRRWRLLIAVAATLALLGPLGWFWWDSRMPGTYSVMDMGYVDYGGGAEPAGHSGMGHDMPGHDMGGGTSVADLVERSDRKPDVTVELEAREQRIDLGNGRTVQGYTFNGTSPGPQITADVGDLVEVHVRNASVDDGITVHWHGIDVPNAEDGVAGVTQDAIGRGEDHTYRFVAEQVGTYWYHSHQVSDEQVRRGLFGAFVVQPKRLPDGVADEDITAVAHTYSGNRTINGRVGDAPLAVAPGKTVRVRVINTDNNTLTLWAGSTYQVLAVDGYDVNAPTPVEDKALQLAAGGRVDLEVTAPARVQIGNATALLVGSDDLPKPAQPEDDLDLLSYGSPETLPFDPDDADRTFEYDIGRRIGFIDGRPGYHWSINGKLWPDVPMYYVEQGDVVRFRIENHSGTVHPMHLHGHHAVVVSRNGRPATGSPWWIDSLDVKDDETYEVAFVADNPGIWMDHCHNLKHAAQGLVAHLMYAGVTTPYRVGGSAGNDPE